MSDIPSHTAPTNLPIPPEPPNLPTANSPNFKEKLCTNLIRINMDLANNEMECQLDTSNEDTGVEAQLINGITTILLSKKIQLYAPWRFSLIIKLMGKRIVHH